MRHERLVTSPNRSQKAQSFLQNKTSKNCKNTQRYREYFTGIFVWGKMVPVFTASLPIGKGPDEDNEAGRLKECLELRVEVLSLQL
jgi:hypothetical protein